MGAEIGLILPAEPGGEAAPGGRSAILALGFRPMYLLAGVYAALSVPLWALQYAGWLPGAGARRVSWLETACVTAVLVLLLSDFFECSWAAPVALAAAALWSAAFTTFVITYYPILTRPRLDGQPG